MASQPKSIKSLRRLYRTPPTSDELRSILHGMLSESNDRTVVIVSSSLLDSALRDVLLRKFRQLDDEEIADLFDADSVLSTFSAKIKMAYALNICGPDIRDDLHCIREIRNAFAHSRIALSFDTTHVSNVCARLKFPKNMGLPANITLSENSPIKSRFLITVNSLTLTLDDLNSRGRSSFTGQLRF